MPFKKITFEEAIKLSKVDDADCYPVASLSDIGFKEIYDWVRETEKRENELAPWYYEAEAEAEALLCGNSATLEMRGMSTKSGIPEIFVLNKNHFDWSIYSE